MQVCAPAGYRLPMDCAVCQHDQEKRREWGCDEPVESPEDFVEPCPFCNGSEGCQDCGGTNRWPVRICPNRTVEPWHRDLYTRCSLVESGVLPDVGGWSDQAAAFTAAYPIVMGEIQRWRDKAQSIADSKAKTRR